MSRAECTAFDCTTPAPGRRYREPSPQSPRLGDSLQVPLGTLDPEVPATVATDLTAPDGPFDDGTPPVATRDEATAGRTEQSVAIRARRAVVVVAAAPREVQGVDPPSKRGAVAYFAVRVLVLEAVDEFVAYRLPNRCHARPLASFSGQAYPTATPGFGDADPVTALHPPTRLEGHKREVHYRGGQRPLRRINDGVRVPAGRDREVVVVTETATEGHTTVEAGRMDKCFVVGVRATSPQRGFRLPDFPGRNCEGNGFTRAT